MLGSGGGRHVVRRLVQFGAVVLLAGVLVSGAPAHRLDASLTAPAQVIEGQKATIQTAAYPSTGSCVLTIVYKGGHVWRATHAATNRFWTFRVPAVPPGIAHLRLNCGAGGVASGTMQVQWALQPPKISVGKEGFSQRNHNYDVGSDVSYAVAIHNDSVRFDATQVSVLVNFVAADNRVLGTDHQALSRLPANSIYYIGAQNTLPTATPIARLEVIVSATPAYKKPALPPLVSDIVFTQTTTPPGYVFSVQGQVLNHFTRPFQSATVGIAILDSAGNIVGGGSAFEQGPVKPNAREIFYSSFGFAPIPFSHAASALVSVVPDYGP